jgi:hypothetical protein
MLLTLSLWVGCAGLVCTGGSHPCIRGFDPRQGRSGYPLTPVFSVARQTNFDWDDEWIRAMILVGSSAGEGISQFLTGTCVMYSCGAGDHRQYQSGSCALCCHVTRCGALNNNVMPRVIHKVRSTIYATYPVLATCGTYLWKPSKRPLGVLDVFLSVHASLSLCTIADPMF